MDRTDRNEQNDTQKKIIFLSLAVLVAVLLIWSFVSSSSARKERDAAVQKLDSMTQAYEKDEQVIKDQSAMIEDLKKKNQQLEARAKAKPAAKKKASKTKKTTKRKGN